MARFELDMAASINEYPFTGRAASHTPSPEELIILQQKAEWVRRTGLNFQPQAAVAVPMVEGRAASHTPSLEEERYLQIREMQAVLDGNYHSQPMAAASLREPSTPAATLK